jgi:hypothetical protein
LSVLDISWLVEVFPLELPGAGLETKVFFDESQEAAIAPRIAENKKRILIIS